MHLPTGIVMDNLTNEELQLLRKLLAVLTKVVDDNATSNDGIHNLNDTVNGLIDYSDPDEMGLNKSISLVNEGGPVFASFHKAFYLGER